MLLISMRFWKCALDHHARKVEEKNNIQCAHSAGMMQGLARNEAVKVKGKK